MKVKLSSTWQKLNEDEALKIDDMFRSIENILIIFKNELYIYSQFQFFGGQKVRFFYRMIINGIWSKLGLKRCKGSPFLSLVRLPSPTDDAMPPAKEDTVVSSTTSLTTTFLGTTDSAVENGKIIHYLCQLYSCLQETSIKG